MSKEAMKLALEALEKLVRFESDSWELGSCRVAGQAIKALREALAEQPAQQEPVAWMNPHGGMLTANYIENFASGLDKEIHNIPLYTSPQPAQQEPVHEFAYKAITKHGHHCHFGTHEAARIWAGKGGKVETIKLRHFELVKTTDTSPPAQCKPLTDEQKDAARWRFLVENSFDKEGIPQFHVWEHSWGPHSQTGEPTEWKQRVRGPALDRFIDRAIEAAHGIKENT